MKKVLKIILIVTIFIVPFNLIKAREKVDFVSCVDGDTIKVKIDNETYTVRMLSVDTPESVHPTKGIEFYGKEASDFTCNTVSKAKIIELEYDENSDKTDKYDRLLAWVFVDDYLLQQLLVSEGYAEVAYLYGDYKYTPLLKDKEAIAQANKKGIWNEDAKSKWDSSTDIKDEKLTIKEILLLIGIGIGVYIYKQITKKINKYKKKIGI